MKTIWKFYLPIGKSIQKMPIPERILEVHGQHNEICMWAMLDSDDVKLDYEFYVAATGENLDHLKRHDHTHGGWMFAGTAHTHGENFVWHVFYRMA